MQKINRNCDNLKISLSITNITFLGGKKNTKNKSFQFQFFDLGKKYFTVK